jgi:ATP-dependent DNA ligase
MTLLTYPARPVNGGPLEKAWPKTGRWFYEPKYNGWRALVHVPSGTMFNRRGQQLSIACDFEFALAAFKDTPFEWLDCEALGRRHELGRDTLIVLDGPILDTQAYTVRRQILRGALSVLRFTEKPKDRSVYLADSLEPPTPAHLFDCWNSLQRLNQQWTCEFYEGVVAKRADSSYPIQLLAPEKEFPFWVKHRWRF